MERHLGSDIARRFVNQPGWGGARVAGVAIVRSALAAVGLLLCACGAQTSDAIGATYYVAPGGNDTAGDGSYSNPWKTLTKAFSVGKGGDTYVLKSGIYNYAGCELSGVKNGSSSGYTVIKSENDGGAVVTRPGAFSLSSGAAYIRIEGFKVSFQDEKQVAGHHIKIMRCSFSGGPPTNNTVGVVVGQGTSYVLFEDCWFYGLGGRYNLLIFMADNIIVRRCVFRHDGGWRNASGENDPEACVCVYNSSNVVLQNCIAIDSDLSSYDYPYGNFAAVHHASIGHAHQNNVWKGCIALNGAGLQVGFMYETDASSGTIEDLVLWKTGFGLSFGASGSQNVSVNRMTVGAGSSGGAGFGSWGSEGSKIIKNVIVTGMPGGDFVGVAASYFDTYGNGTTSSGTGRVTFNPLSNGLSFLPRIEIGSPLKSAGENGGQIGAQVMTRIGVSGTLFGEAGYDLDTGEALWPWPYEDRIKADMAETSTRGFCAPGTTLTKYIFEQLGNPVPGDISKAPRFPGGMLVQ